MELRQLRYFIAVAEELHFERAAERVGIEPSPLSRAIRDLECELGVRLLDRSGHGTRLTRAGQALLADARHLFVWVDRARLSAVQAAKGRTGRLCIGLSPSLTGGRLAPLLRRCRDEAPELELALSQVAPERAAAALECGLLDLALVPGRTEGRRLRSEPLWHEALRAVLPVDHPLAAKRVLAVSELADWPPLLCPADLAAQCAELLASSRTRSRMALAPVSDALLLKALVGARLGLGLASAAQEEALRANDVVVRPLTGDRAGFVVHALVRSSNDDGVVDWVIGQARGMAASWKERPIATATGRDPQRP